MDESRRGRAYYITAIALDPADAPELRRILREQLRGRARRLHFAKESSATRSRTLRLLGPMPLWAGTWTCQIDHGINERAARDACLRQFARWVLKSVGMAQIVIESCDDAEDQRDRAVMLQALGKSTVHYRHARPHEEPLLWLPDAVAWSAGAGQRWRHQLPAPLRKVVAVQP